MVAQRQCERAILYVVNERYELCPTDNLAYSGGVALNAVANRLIKQQSKFKNVYVQPAAGDNGLSLGCAFYGWSEVLEGKRHPHGGSSHFGRRYHVRETSAALAEYESLCHGPRHEGWHRTVGPTVRLRLGGRRSLGWEYFSGC